MSNVDFHESRLSCNGEAIYWDLRDPVKAMLSATVLVMGGLVPLHVGYNHPRHRTTQGDYVFFFLPGIDSNN